MGGKAWSEAEIEKLARLANEGRTNMDIRDQFPGRSEQAIRQKRDDLGLPQDSAARFIRNQKGATLTRVVSETPECVIYAPEESDEEPFEDLLKRAMQQTDRDTAKAYSRRFCAAEIVSTRPIAICFASDQHLTMHGPCDVRQAFRDAEVIQQTPGLYVMLGGDGVDNHVKHRAAMVGKGSRPTDEYRLYDGYLRTLGSKILAVISGNHDDWTRDATGIDMVGILASKHRLHYAPDEVVMEIRILPAPNAEPTQTYVIKMRHQYRFNSSLNVGHSVKRMYDMGGDVFDIGVICHNHEAHVETFDRHGLTRWALRPGSYQAESSFSRRIGFGQSYPTCPGVVLWPRERRIEAFDDLRGVAEKLQDARAA